MKKRLVSVFLVVSIIISVFAISAINTSARRYPTPAAPGLEYAIPIHDGTMLCVRWIHDGRWTKNYHVWLCEKNADRKNRKNWKEYVTTSSAQKYLVIKSGLKPHTSYIVKISALGTNGSHSVYSDWIENKDAVVNLNANIYDAQLFPGTTKATKWAKIEYGISNSTKYVNDYYVCQYVNGKLAPNRKLKAEQYNEFTSGTALNSQRLSYKVQAVFEIDGHKYTSGWSCVRTALW